MTREEHIENLKAMASDMPSDKCSDWIDSLMAGVKALEQEPCDDAISRQAVIDTIDKWVKNMHVLITLPANEVTPLFESMHELPPVTPQPKRGRWINAKVGKLFPSNDYKCSECGNILDFDGVNCGRGDANYCPNCGAKMSEIPTVAEGSEE